MPFPSDYAERVYAGVLGKIIGVYLGRPFEGWTYERIMGEFGEIDGYINHRSDLPLRNHHLVVADDDISGTFTFLRALPDYGYAFDLSPAQIGQTWLNYLIENRTVLWWGGMGNSTEHTAYLRLKNGIPAPRSGSIALNGKVVAEQIGAQIFIEGWGLIAPGDPSLATDLARRAASVSHDGEAIYAAQVVAALVAQAFVESDIDELLDTAVSFIPTDALIYRLITDIRAWQAADPTDWHAARARLAQQYGYDRYGGNCHIVPNHGLVILSLCYGQGDFSKSQTIVNTSGWDTDCNAANVGCILGVRNGLAAFEGGPDWRGPVADQLYLPTADGGRAISDALRETDFILKTAYAIKGEELLHPKGGARFHFSLPGSVQGFRPKGSLVLKNDLNPFRANQRVLALRYQLAAGETAAAFTPTFIPPEAINMPGYELLASPTLYPGQTVHAELLADKNNNGPIKISLVLLSYSDNDRLASTASPATSLLPGNLAQLEWLVPDLGSAPIAQVGLSIASEQTTAGSVYLDTLTWGGIPRISYHCPTGPGKMWKRQWVDAVDGFEYWSGEGFQIIQNRGRGMVITGTREWTDISLEATLTPHLAKAFGLAVHVQGLERYYALLFQDRDIVKLVKRLDGEKVLDTLPWDWEFGQSYTVNLVVQDLKIQAWVDGRLLFTVTDHDQLLTAGGIALVCEEGRLRVDNVVIKAVDW